LRRTTDLIVEIYRDVRLDLLNNFRSIYKDRIVRRKEMYSTKPRNRPGGWFFANLKVLARCPGVILGSKDRD
jgi:hypothetical protein